MSSGGPLGTAGLDEGFPKNLVEFLDRFATNEACLDYLCQVRWPQGVFCPQCGSCNGWPTKRGTWFCSACRRQPSPTAGTILHDLRTPIRKWFLAVWLLCTQKTGVSAKTLQRELQIGYKTAWLILHKLRQATVRVERSQLSGTVEVDETYVGGAESGVGGRELVGKALVAIAVELDGKKVGRVRLRKIPNASGESLVGFLTDCVAKGTQVRTDDWNGYNGVQAAGFAHRVTPIHGDPERALKYFPHVHLVASLLKRWLGATHQGRGEKPHLQAYLDEYAFRFNRRRSMHVGKIFHRLVEQMVMHQAKTYRQIVDGSKSDSSEGHMQIPAIPSGLIALWSGRVAQVPAGWALCDGRNGTPDLRDRFVVGAGQDVGSSACCTLEGSGTQRGGSLTHKHHFTTDGHLHWTKSSGSMFDAPNAPSLDITRDKDSGTTDGPDTVPVPYYALAYIMKL